MKSLLGSPALLQDVSAINPCPDMCCFPQALKTVAGGVGNSFSPLWLVPGYYVIALGIRALFCFWPIPLTALKYILSLKFHSNLVDYEERAWGIHSKTQITQTVGSGWDYLNAKDRRVPACPSWLNLSAISDTRFVAVHPIHSIHNSSIWVSIHAFFCTPIAACSVTYTKRLISQGLCHGSHAIFKQLAPAKPSKRRVNTRRTEKHTLSQHTHKASKTVP